jgi:hypothetical protein
LLPPGAQASGEAWLGTETKEVAEVQEVEKRNGAARRHLAALLANDWRNVCGRKIAMIF